MDQIMHGPFLVDHEGGLTPMRPPALRFAWRGRGCDLWLEEGAIRLAALAGRVPSTAGQAAARPGAFALLGAMPGELPAGWRLRLTADHRVRLESQQPMAGVATATQLVGAMVGFALTLDPYLDRLEAAGVG